MSEQMELPIRRAREALAEEPTAPKSEVVAGRESCTMGMGCEGAGVCYAEAMGEPERCNVQPKTKKGRIALVQREPVHNEAEALTGYSDWLVNKLPPCAGYWDTCVVGTDEHQRLWFTPTDDPVTGGGMWYEPRVVGLKFVGSHAEIGGQLKWRGLAQPWWLGYPWPVPGAKRERVRLQS